MALLAAPEKRLHKIERIPTLKESELRQLILGRIERVEAKKLQSLVSLVRKFFPKVSAEDIAAKLKHAVIRAEKSIGWGSLFDVVKIGYYRDTPEYCTTLFHECGHSILSQLGRTDTSYLKDPLKEEKFCWQFSKACSALFGYAYSQAMEDVAKKFYALTDRLAKGKTKKLDGFIAMERKELGYSELGGDRLRWEDDRPVIVQSEEEVYAQAA